MNSKSAQVNQHLADYDAFSVIVATSVFIFLSSWVLNIVFFMWRRVRKEGIVSIAIGMFMHVASFIPPVARAIQVPHQLFNHQLFTLLFLNLFHIAIYQAEKDKALQQIREHAVPKRKSTVPPVHEIPTQAIPRAQVLKMLEVCSCFNVK
jgi:hypothetical protein